MWVVGAEDAQSPALEILQDIHDLSVVFRANFTLELLLRDTVNGLSALELEPQD